MFLVKVRFLSKEEGGRSFPPLSGYPPQVAVGAESTACRLIGENPQYVFEFHQEHEALLELNLPEIYGHYFKAGDKVLFLEGSRKVGEGIILE
jgi:translation elongation factor EF-Tu-like GTPase